MNPTRILVVGFVFVGCAQTADDDHTDRASEDSASATQSGAKNESQPAPSQITNRYGMTFCLVTVDSTRPDHQDSYPRQSYYLQQTELTSEPFRKYGEDTVKNWADRVNMQFPEAMAGDGRFGGGAFRSRS